jgi:hypothetical protein
MPDAAGRGHADHRAEDDPDTLEEADALVAALIQAVTGGPRR